MSELTPMGHVKCLDVDDELRIFNSWEISHQPGVEFEMTGRRFEFCHHDKCPHMNIGAFFRGVGSG